MIHREQDIIDWGLARNIIGPTGQGTRRSQHKKTMEETKELYDAISLQELGFQEIEDQKPAARGAIGAIIVTLVLQAQMWGLTLAECLDAAWDEIKNRTGHMEDGIFIKD